MLRSTEEPLLNTPDGLVIYSILYLFFDNDIIYSSKAKLITERFSYQYIEIAGKVQNALEPETTEKK